LLAGLAGAAETADAETLLRRGRIGEAIAAAETAARAAPADLDTQELYIDLLQVVGQTGRAVNEARARVEKAPRDPDAHYLLGRALPDLEEARASYEAALRLAPNHARSFMGMGAVHEAAGRRVEAVAAYTRAVELDPTLAEAWLGRVRVLLQLDRRDEALAVARAGWSAVPTEPSLALTVAALQPASAKAVLEEAAARVPDDARTFEALAALALDQGDAATAEARASQALAIDPTLPDAIRIRLVSAEIRRGRLDRAAWNTLAGLRGLERSDPAAALAGYPPLVSAWPKSALVFLGRSSARRATGSIQGALEDAVVASRLDPSNTEAVAVAGLLLLDAGRAADAEPLLAKAATERTWDASLALAWVRALRELGRAEEASDLLATIANVHRFDPAVQVAYADDLAKAGRIEEAYRRLKETLLVVPHPQLAAAFVRVAPAAGHPEEAAALLDQIVARTGNAELAEAARRLRASAP
jgi:tetratricopeptide (TPR) repeat protein